METEILKAEKVFKSYSGLAVLRGVNLSIAKGEVVSIVGASGAGKSTLLHILGTLDGADSGELRLDGHDLLTLSGSRLAKFRNLNIGFVFQFHNLLPEFNAIENVCIPGFLAGKPEKQVRARAQELLDLLGVGSRAKHKPSQLSGGEQQRERQPELVERLRPVGVAIDVIARRVLDRLPAQAHAARRRRAAAGHLLDRGRPRAGGRRRLGRSFRGKCGCGTKSPQPDMPHKRVTSWPT